MHPHWSLIRQISEGFILLCCADTAFKSQLNDGMAGGEWRTSSTALTGTARQRKVGEIEVQALLCEPLGDSKSLDQLYKEYAFCHGDGQSHVDISMANIISNKNTSVRLR